MSNQQFTPPMPIMMGPMQSPQYRIIYANMFSMRPTATDFSITFGVQIPVGQPGSPQGATTAGHVAMATLEEVNISMTLASAKILCENLNRIFETVEKAIGRVKIPGSARLAEPQLKALAESLGANDLVE